MEFNNCSFDCTFKNQNNNMFATFTNKTKFIADNCTSTKKFRISNGYTDTIVGESGSTNYGVSSDRPKYTKQYSPFFETNTNKIVTRITPNSFIKDLSESSHQNIQWAVPEITVEITN